MYLYVCMYVCMYMTEEDINIRKNRFNKNVA